PTRIEPQIRTMIDHGIQALISFKPSRKHLTPAERGRLSAAVTMFRKHGLLAETCLWQEVGPKVMSATQYHEYVRYFGPAIREHYPLVFDAPGFPGPSEWKAYDPTHKYVDGYAVDIYCSSFIKEHRRLDGLIALAGDLPVGVWEIGNTAEKGFFPTKKQLDAYMDHIRATLSKRAASGLPVGSIAWYNGPNPRTPQGNQNEIVGDHPDRLAAE